MDPGLEAALEAAGGVRALARKAGVSHVSVLRWKKSKIPLRWIFIVEKETGIPRERLRPDIFLAPRPRSRQRR